MKKVYLTGATVSTLIHIPLLRHKEYSSYLFAIVLWPLPAIVYAVYFKYVLFGSLNHTRMVISKTGGYSENIS